MYRIYINSTVNNCANNFAQAIRNGNPFKSDLKHFEQNLTCSNDKSFEKKAKEYVNLLLEAYKESPVYPPNTPLHESILISKSSSFPSFAALFENIISQAELGKKIEYTNSNGTVCDDAFWKVLVRVMNYSKFKSSYYQCIEDLGIGTCVYCNMSPADKDANDSANYQMEHFWPKNQFPFLSTSFFNFFPSCGYCNQKKGSTFFDTTGFDLYREKITDCSNPFKFSSPDAICYYNLLSKDKDKFEKCKKVKIFFSSANDYAKKQMHQLDIQNRYNCKRVRYKIFQLLFKYERYTKTQINVTQNSFPKLIALSTDSIYDVFGDYSKEENIHRDLLTKLSIDFGKETGMI